VHDTEAGTYLKSWTGDADVNTETLKRATVRQNRMVEVIEGYQHRREIKSKILQN
jgi:hypothetical protein